MSKCPDRDSSAPRRNLSAFLLYQNAMRDTYKLQYMATKYAEMSPQEKQHWVSRAEADRSRYLHELSTYVPPPDHSAKGGNSVRKQNKKTSRDPNAPKKNASAYMLYQNSMRDHFKAANPDMSFGQLSTYTSVMYKSLTSQEKRIWEERAQSEKERYDAEMASYVPPPGYNSQGLKPKPKSKRDPLKPKRPRGSFVFFTFEMRGKILQECPSIKFIEMGNVLGQRWRSLTAQQKQKYEDMAQNDKIRFRKEMQLYQRGSLDETHECSRPEKLTESKELS